MFYFLKTKVVPSRSGSTQSFDEALRESEAMRRASGAPTATSPTIPEDKLLSQSPSLVRNRPHRHCACQNNADNASRYITVYCNLYRGPNDVRTIERASTPRLRARTSKYYPTLSNKVYIFLARHSHTFPRRIFLRTCSRPL